MMTFTLAWRNIWRHTRRTLITAVAMALGVALCMGYLAFADGAFAMIFDRMVGQQIGHAQVHSPLFPKQRALYETLDDTTALEQRLRDLPLVGGVAGRVLAFGLFAQGDEATGGQIMGIIPADEQAVRGWKDQVKEGQYLSDQPGLEMLLGYKLAETLKAKVGSEVVVVTQSADGSMGNEVYKVVGIIRTGATMVDRTAAVIHRKDAQALLALGDQSHEIAVVARERDRIDEMVATLKDALKDEKVLVRSWGEVSPMAQQWMNMQDAMFIIVAVLVLVVSGLGILNTMLMSVFERTRELGVLIALGLKPYQVLMLILAETLLLTLVATLIGALLGGLLCWWIVVHGVDFGAEIQFSGVTWDAVIKGTIRPVSIVVTLLTVFIVSLLSSVWPAARAARLQPVVAMRDP